MLLDIFHKLCGGSAGVDFFQRTHGHIPRGDLLFDPQRADHTANQPGLGKFLGHACDAKTDAGQRNQQIVGTQFDLGLQLQPVSMDERNETVTVPGSSQNL